MFLARGMKIYNEEKKKRMKVRERRDLVRIAEARRLRENPILIYFYGRMGQGEFFLNTYWRKIEKTQKKSSRCLSNENPILSKAPKHLAFFTSVTPLTLSQVTPVNMCDCIFVSNKCTFYPG